MTQHHLGFHATVTDRQGARYPTGRPAEFVALLERHGRAYPALTQPDMRRLPRKARAVRFAPEETAGKYRLGTRVHFTVTHSREDGRQLAEPRQLEGEVWSLAPDGGVWVATPEGDWRGRPCFYWISRKDRTVRRYADRREQVLGIAS